MKPLEDLLPLSFNLRAPKPEDFRKEKSQETYRPYVTTYTGRKVFIDNPDDDAIHISDIIHQLSMKVRFGGAIKEFYSVAQHSCYCYYLAKKMNANLPTLLATLLHDANEAAYPDVQRPIKMFLPEWKHVEIPLECAIYDKYLGDYKFVVDWGLVKSVDNILLVTEAKELLHDSSWAWEDKWIVHFEETPFTPDITLNEISDRGIYADWPWRQAKIRFREELDKVATLMVERDSEWDILKKELEEIDVL